MIVELIVAAVVGAIAVAKAEEANKEREGWKSTQDQEFWHSLTAEQKSQSSYYMGDDGELHTRIPGGR